MERTQELDLRRYLRSQRELAARLIEARSLEEVAPAFLSTLAELLRWEAGGLWEVREGASALSFLSGWSVQELDAEPLWEASREIHFGPGTGLPGRAWETGDIAWAPDFSHDPQYPRGSISAELGLTAALAIPIPIGSPGGVLAVAEFHTNSFTAQSDELMALLATFGDQLASFIERGRVESRLEAGEGFKAAMLAASMDCIIGMDDNGTVLEFNEVAERLFGYRREEVLGRELAELIIPPDLRERHRAGLRRYLETGEGVVIDRRVELPAMRSDGSLISVELTVTRIEATEPPIFTGFVRDVSERAEAERVRKHLAEVVRGTQDAVLTKDLEGVLTSWNPAAERLYGYSAEEAIGRHISFLIPPDHKDEEKRILERVCRGERLETYETERIRADGARIAVSLTVSQIASPAHGVVGASVVARDITAQTRRRRAQEFLVAASRLLDTSLDPAETARTIVGTAVPELAAYCVIDFLRDDGFLGDSVVAGADPQAAAKLEELRRSRPLDPDGPHPVAQVLRERRPMIWPDLRTPEVIEQVAQSDEHRRLMGDAEYNSAAVVPLVARGRTIGALSFLHASRDLRFAETDLDFLAELGDRAAMALDNARLYRDRDRIAASLQSGLRPPHPAQVEGLDISVVFEAAGEGIEIGGDFYDVIPTEDGCWVLIGDVAGKGSAAAGVSVAVRHAVRGLTRVVEEPDEVLARVNELLLAGDTLNDFATASLVRMRREAGVWRIVLCSAGHPPAIHLGPAGPAPLGGGAILGGWADADVGRHELTLDDGHTLVLCTDGWLEAGPPATHHGPQELAAKAHSLAAAGLEELTEGLRRDALDRGGGELRDDLVVLAVRPGVAKATAGASSAWAAAG
jgi:PAS domain S-box-containing protein